MFKCFRKKPAPVDCSKELKAMEDEMVELIKSREEWFCKSVQHQREAESAAHRMRWFEEREGDVQLLLVQLRGVELPADVAALAKSVADFEIIE